jgi:hypothetical protein
VSAFVVGPRSLSAAGEVEVWIDSGSGPGFVTPVPVNRLTLAPVDDGQGKDATYVLHPNIPALADD